MVKDGGQSRSWNEDLHFRKREPIVTVRRKRHTSANFDGDRWNKIQTAHRTIYFYLDRIDLRSRTMLVDAQCKELSALSRGRFRKKLCVLNQPNNSLRNVYTTYAYTVTATGIANVVKLRPSEQQRNVGRCYSGWTRKLKDQRLTSRQCICIRLRPQGVDGIELALYRPIKSSSSIWMTLSQEFCAK